MRERESNIWFMWGNPKSAINPGQLEIIAKIVGNSVSTYKERHDRGKKYFVALGEAQLRDGQKLDEFTLNLIAKYKAELEVEQTGSGVER